MKSINNKFLETEAVKKITNFHMPRWNEIPNIDLYMDQVIKFVSETLEILYPSDTKEKIITKSMINNYVKLKVIKSPTNKKYNKSHLAHLIAISILKSVYSISEISTFIKMQEKKYDTNVAYDYMCDEMENIISATFHKREEFIPYMTQHRGNEIEIIRSSLIAISNKIFVQLYTKYLEESEK